MFVILPEHVNTKVRGTGKVHTGFWWGNPRKGDHFEDQSPDGSIILKWIFETWDEGGEGTRSILLRIETGGGLLLMR